MDIDTQIRLDRLATEYNMLQDESTLEIITEGASDRWEALFKQQDDVARLIAIEVWLEWKDRQ